MRERLPLTGTVQRAADDACATLRRSLTLLRPTSHMEFIYELLHFLKVRKKFWLLPIIIVMLVFGGLIVLAQGSAVAPFIYTLF